MLKKLIHETVHLKSVYEFEVMKYELHFRTPVPQEVDEPLDTLNDYIHSLFSFGLREFEEVNIDWRDDQTVWVTIGSGRPL